MEVRDPIYGAIPILRSEEPVIDHEVFNRLRSIRQMGFSERPFPGAGHSRFLHSVGVMHLAGQAFDAAFREHPLSEGARRRFRECVRLAALLHDVGHAPFSHCTEFTMPPLRALGIGVYADGVLAERGAARASHEDYTIGLLTRSALTPVLAQGFECQPVHIAALISREVVCPDGFFVDQGRDYRRVLSQVISSELDVDRLDYLVRDSYFSGARYGQVDAPWLLNNLAVFEQEGTVSLALDRRALYAFDDFLIARYHMFVMVYFHHKSVVYEEMLKRYFQGPDCDYALPTDMDAYANIDDPHLLAHLRARRDNRWARDLSEHRPWERVIELHGTEAEVNTTELLHNLDHAGIEHLSASSVGRLSRYSEYGQKREGAPAIWVVDRALGRRDRPRPLHEATHIFARYQDERCISRVYVHPEQRGAAQRVLGVG